MKIENAEVTLVDSMGSDLSVVNAARVSFQKESEWENQHDQSVEFSSPIAMPSGIHIHEIPDPNFDPRLSEPDQKLIRYLAKHNHFTPFCHSFLSFRIKANIAVARQLV